MSKPASMILGILTHRKEVTMFNWKYFALIAFVALWAACGDAGDPENGTMVRADAGEFGDTHADDLDVMDGCQTDNDCNGALSYCEIDTGECRGCILDEHCNEFGKSICGEDGMCRSCSGFFSNECPAGERCLPWADGGAVCIAQGAGEAGDDCISSTECGRDLLCSWGTCTRFDCIPSSSDSCDTGICYAYISPPNESLDVGQCAGSCTAFDEDGSDCLPAEWCFPQHWDESSGSVGGTCIVKGQASENEPCTRNDQCESNHGCIGDRCRQLCDRFDEPGSRCPSDLKCQSTWTDSSMERWALAVCLPGCTPFTEDDGCGPDQWCFPDEVIRGSGRCITAGDRPRGESCSDGGARCRPGLTCIDGTCERICDYRAVSPAPGSCDAGRVCRRYFSEGGVLLNVGFCTFECGLDEACSAPDQACILESWTNLGIRACMTTASLEPGASCSAEGLEDYTFCGPNRICWEGVCRQGCQVQSTADYEEPHESCAEGSVCSFWDGSTGNGLCRLESTL